MYWIFRVKFVDLGDSCAVGGEPAMNIIIARVPVLNAPEQFVEKHLGKELAPSSCICKARHMEAKRHSLT